MKAFVTGSNGFIGSFLVEKLLKEGYSVRCLVRRTSNIRWLNDLNVDLCYGELRDPASLHDAVQNVDIVYHLGGVTRGRTEKEYINGNYKATKNLLNACRRSGHPEQKFVFVSSQAAGGPSINGEFLTEEGATLPISMYGRSKLMAERAVLDFARFRPATIIRPPSVYGPRDKDFYTLFRNARYGFLPVVGKGRQKISIIYISDLVNGLYLAGSQPASNGQLFFMSSDESVSFSELAGLILRTMGVRARLLNIPFGAVKLIVSLSVLASQLTKKTPLINWDKFEEMKQSAWLCSSDKAKRLLDFQAAIGLQEGIKRTAAWYKENGWL